MINPPQKRKRNITPHSQSADGSFSRMKQRKIPPIKA
jgi:hypothetical protein